MGRNPFNYTEVESLGISTKFLKEHNFFYWYKTGRITWTWGNECESSIRLTVDLRDATQKIRFNYITGKGTEDERRMDYSYNLHKVPCNLGGYRWAIGCGFYRNNRYCGRKVYTLFKPPNSDYFGCRKCMHIIYESQRRSRYKYKFLDRIFKADEKIIKLEEAITKLHYKGKYTKKVKKLLKLKSIFYGHDDPISIFEKLLR